MHINENRRMGQGKSWHFVLKEDHRCKFYNLCIQNSPRNLNLIFINSNSYHYLADFHETLIRVPDQNRQEICFFLHSATKTKPEQQRQQSFIIFT